MYNLKQEIFYAYRMDGTITKFYKEDANDLLGCSTAVTEQANIDLNVVWVCLLEDKQGNVARGMSVLSKKDIPSIEGLNFAEQRAIRALKDRPMDKIRRPEILSVLIKTNCPFVRKGEKNPQLTFKEMCALYSKRKVMKEGRKAQYLFCGKKNEYK